MIGGDRTVTRSDDFEWNATLQLDFRLGPRVEVLQRDVQRVDVFKQDLLPYYETHGIWTSRMQHPNSLMTAGRLLSYTDNDRTDVFVVSSERLSIEFRVAGVTARTLTVWRYDGVLDALQVRISGESSYLYGRLGGARIAATLAGSPRLCGSDENTLSSARHVFETGEVLWLQEGNPRSN